MNLLGKKKLQQDGTDLILETSLQTFFFDHLNDSWQGIERFCGYIEASMYGLKHRHVLAFSHFRLGSPQFMSRLVARITEVNVKQAHTPTLAPVS